jgi:hypothetical protein
LVDQSVGYNDASYGNLEANRCCYNYYYILSFKRNKSRDENEMKKSKWPKESKNNWQRMWGDLECVQKANPVTQNVNERILAVESEDSGSIPSTAVAYRGVSASSKLNHWRSAIYHWIGFVRSLRPCCSPLS